MCMTEGAVDHVVGKTYREGVTQTGGLVPDNTDGGRGRKAEMAKIAQGPLSSFNHTN